MVLPGGSGGKSNLSETPIMRIRQRRGVGTPSGASHGAIDR